MSAVDYIYAGLKRQAFGVSSELDAYLEELLPAKVVGVQKRPYPYLGIRPRDYYVSVPLFLSLPERAGGYYYPQDTGG